MFTAAAGGARRPLCAHVGGRLPWPPPSAVREVTLAATLHTAWVPGNAPLLPPAHPGPLVLPPDPLLPPCHQGPLRSAHACVPFLCLCLSVSLSLSVSPSLYLSVSLSLPFSPSLSLSFHLSLFVSASPSISVSVSNFLSSPPSLCLSLLPQFFFPSILLSWGPKQHIPCVLN